MREFESNVQKFMYYAGAGCAVLSAILMAATVPLYVLALDGDMAQIMFGWTLVGLVVGAAFAVLYRPRRPRREYRWTQERS